MDDKATVERASCVALIGSDGFLCEQAAKITIAQWDIPDASVEIHYGEEVKWVDVHDRLATRSLFDAAGHKVFVLKEADKFVTQHRDQLERWLGSAPPDASLILQVAKMPSNTRLYQQIKKTGQIVDCRVDSGDAASAAADRTTAAWVVSWGNRRHGLRLTAAQAGVMVERIGGVFGLLDCELAKLALFADDKGRVDAATVDELVGGWRAKTVWQIADWVADGEIAAALGELDRLFQAGQHPMAIMPQIAWVLRRFGVAAQLLLQAKARSLPMKTTDALSQAGIQPFRLAAAEKQLRRIGTTRAARILDWLVELDLKLKGSHSQEDRSRMAVEEFLLRFH